MPVESITDLTTGKAGACYWMRRVNSTDKSKGTKPGATHARFIALLCLLGGGSLLGIKMNLAKVAGDLGLSALALLAWSIVGAALMLLVLAGVRRRSLPISRRTFEYYVVSGLIGVAGPSLIFFAAIPHIGASFVALIVTSPPLLTYIGALAVGLERFQTSRALGVTAALSGTAFLAAQHLSAPEGKPLWLALVLIGPVLLAAGNLYRTLRWPEGTSPSTLAPGMLVAAAIMLLCTGLLPGFSLAVPLDSAKPLVLIIMQALVFAGFYLFLFHLQKAGGPVLLSLLGSVGAVVGVPIAILVQNEAPPGGLFVSATLIAVGIALVTLGHSRALTKKASV